MADDIRIKISVDDSQAKSALNNVQKELAQTATTAVRADSSLQKLGRGSAQATNALTNLGRVVQDAPFGFIGITNNINPLLESFQRLKLETGSTKEAFKQLASGLIGGGGIGLAVSAATSVLTVLAMNGFFNTAKEADKAAQNIKKFNDEVKGIAQDAAKEQANVLILVKALESETVSRKEKLSAIKELQRINPQYFGDLRLENDLVIGLSSAYEKYKNSILATIQNKIDAKQLENVLERINTATEQQQRNQLAIQSNEQKIAELYKKGGTSYVAQLQTLNKVLSNTSVLTRLEKERDEILARIADRNFVGQTDVELEKVRKAGETVNDVLVKLSREIALLNEQELQLGSDETKAKISAIENAIQRLVKDFKVSPQDTIIQKLFGDIKDLQIRRIDIGKIKVPTSLEIKEALDKAREDADKDLGKNPLILKAQIRFPNSGFAKEVIERAKIIQDAFDDISVSASKLQNDIFVSLAKGIGEALGSGGNVLQGALEGILHIMGKFLVQLGEAAILSSTLAIAIKNIFKSPIGGLVAGIAAVAIGTVLQSIKLPAFAGGVENFSGGLALVGERGPELVNLPRGSDVIPNHRIGNLQGGGMQVFIPETRISGSDIVIAYKRQTARNSRNG